MKFNSYLLAGFIFLLVGMFAETWAVRIPFLLLGVGLLLVNVLRLLRDRQG